RSVRVRLLGTRRSSGQPAWPHDIAAWWSRHAIRAADDELPNVFLERQADELVVSWDALPTPARFYNIPNGEEVLPITFAVPVLRQMVRARLKAMDLDAAQRSTLLPMTSADTPA